MERTKQLKFYCPQRSWGKVIFLHMYVILFMGDVCLSACWDTHLLPGADPPPQKQTPPQSRHPHRADTQWEQTPPRAVHAWRYGQQAGGMHPTGMQSCFHCHHFVNAATCYHDIHFFCCRCHHSLLQTHSMMTMNDGKIHLFFVAARV